MEKILKAFDKHDIIVKSGGRSIMEGNISEGIRLKLVIDDCTGKVITSYAL